MIKGWLFLLSLIAAFNSQSQTVRGKLQFRPQQVLIIEVEMKTTVIQQAMGKAIDFSTTGSALHSYKVTGVGNNSISLQHEFERMQFDFEGMGQKHSYNSANAADTASQYNHYIRKIINSKYQLTIDENGNVTSVNPEKFELTQGDDKMAMVSAMLKDITDMAYPPGKDEGSFFKILPGKEISTGDSWTDSVKTATGSRKETYTLKNITDSTINIDFTGVITSTSKTMMMGREAVISINKAETGQVVLDRATGIIREKIINTESSGTMEAMGGSMPVNEKSSIIIHVKSE